MARPKQPWRRWRFSLPLFGVTILFGWMAWNAIGDTSIPLQARIAGFAVFGILALLFGWWLWRNRYPLRCQFGSFDRKRGAGREKDPRT